MFERFTPQARTVVVGAQEEARVLGHGYVGTEHLLLALLAGPDNGAAQVVTAMGLDSTAVRDEILSIVGPGEGAPSGHIPFTPRAKKVLELSLREALALKHGEIAAEHVLLGLVREGDGLAALILTKHGIELEDLRRQVIARLGAGTGRKAGRFRRGAEARALTPGAASAADRAVALAGSAPIASHHYLLALLEDPDSAAARALSGLGVTREGVEAKLAELGTAGTRDAPADEGAGRTRLSVEGEAVLVELTEPELARRLGPLLRQRGVDVPGLEAVWHTMLPVLTSMVHPLEAIPPPTPPGWSEAGVAALAVTSLADGPSVRLWTRPGADAGAVAAVLAAWLRERPPGDECNYLTVTVGAADDDRIVLSGYSAGIAPDRPGWRPRPVWELVEAAMERLEPQG